MSTGDFVFDMPKNRNNSIKVIGVGGGGSNAVNYMFDQGITGVDFIICNTDAQALNNSTVPNKIQLGQSVTEGLGAGANPEVGEQAALESLEDIKAALEASAKMVFITAGMGGGTGTGAAPIIAGIAKEMGILTVGIVTAPFYFEGKMRLEQAEKGIEKLRKNCDSLIVINNDKLRELYGNLGYKSGFAKADEILTTAAKGIAEVITHHYSTNIDMRDARTVLAESGTAVMGTGKGGGENKAHDAIAAALDSPLLNNNKITGAKNVLLLILSGDDEITIDEIGIINDYIQNEAGHNANIIMGIGEDLDLGDKVSVTVVATGFPMDDQAYTGREEQKIFHTLEEEQAISKKLEVTPVVVKQLVEEEKEKEPFLVSNEPVIVTQEEPAIEEKEIRFILEEEEEKPVEKKITDEYEPQLKERSNEIIEDIEPETPKDFTRLNPMDMPLPESNVKKIDNFQGNIFGEDYKEEEFEPEVEAKTVIFTIDEPIENFENKSVFQKSEPAAEVKEEKPVFIPENDPVNSPIASDNISNTIEERRAKLKQFNFKFKNALQNNTVDQIESIPAYKRQGLVLNERENKKPSEFVVGKNSENEIKIRPNNFLHDNVD